MPNLTMLISALVLLCKSEFNNISFLWTEIMTSTIWCVIRLSFRY